MDLEQTHALLRKYNVPGPRYTSYPTVPYWTDSPTSEQWMESVSLALAEARIHKIGAALYVHIPFCEALCTYCGCNTRITRNHDVALPYVESVLKEWDLYLDRLGADVLISEIHLGGGTPTFLTPYELRRLIEGLLEKVKVTPDSEFSVEADPRVTTRAHLEVLAQLGFKRLSLGIQDFDPRVQTIVHRVQTEAQVLAVTEVARELGFESINFDLIYGLPLQTNHSVGATVDAVKRLRPDRIAFYGYAHVPWIKPGQRRFTEDDLPNPNQKRSLYEIGRDMLQEAGYHEVGMDHFALESDTLWKAAQDRSLHRNFMGYTTKQVSPLIGLGVSSIGDSWRIFAQNEKLVEAYQERVAKGELPIIRGHILNSEDLILRRHVLNIMTHFQTEWSRADSYTPHLEMVPTRLSEAVLDGLVKLGPHRCEVTEKGRAFLRNICMAFDARLFRQSPLTSNVFSKTI